MKNILVALEFRENSGIIIDHAAALAKAMGSKIWLLHIAQDDPNFIGYQVGPQYVRNMRADELREEHRMLQQLALELEKSGIEADAFLVNGKTVETILEEARQLKADLIVTAHHSRSFVSEAIMGDITTELVRKSGIPILVIPITSE